MANENSKKRRKKLRQEWNPHWSLKTLYTLGSTALSVVKLAIGAALTVALILLICGVVFVGTLGDYLQNDILKEASDWSIDDYDLEKTSFLYYVDSNGDIQQLQQIYTTTDRQIATLDEIPQDLINATVAIEDKRFYEHQGVDWITTVKACMNMFFGGDSQFGGSTITQQLIKNNVFPNFTKEKTFYDKFQRKIQEQYLALQIEKKMDKSEIIESYLNTINLGQNCLGVQAASQRYFGKDVSDLTLSECAVIAGITQSPSTYDPITHPDNNKVRRNKVLKNMLEQDYISQKQYDEALADDVYARIQTTNTASQADNTYSYFVDALAQQVIQDLKDQLGYTDTQAYNAVYSGGLSIYSTQNQTMQQIDRLCTDCNPCRWINGKLWQQ